MSKEIDPELQGALNEIYIYQDNWEQEVILTNQMGMALILVELRRIRELLASRL